jgi:hypothetical protein
MGCSSACRDMYAWSVLAGLEKSIQFDPLVAIRAEKVHQF